MKKWAILVLVVLASALLLLQYAAEKKKTAMTPGSTPAPTAEQPLGVALPAEASKPVTVPVDSYISQSGRGPIVIPLVQSAYKGACEGGSLKDMMLSHDSYWGSFAKDSPFLFEDTQKMYDFMVDYVSCQAAARADVSLCDSLPGPGEKDGVAVSLEVSPSSICRKKITMLLFESYLAGNIKGDSYCRLGLADTNQADLSKFSIPEFCEVASKGPESAVSFLLKAFAPGSPEVSAYFATRLPAKESDCREKPECLVEFGLYDAMKKGHPADCPAEYKAQCQALSGRSTASCEKILPEMSKFYCASMERAKKARGGYVGMSKEAVAEDIQKKKQEKAEAERIKKEQDQIQLEVNKRVKEVLKKK